MLSIGIGKFNTFEKLNSIEALGILYNFVEVLLLRIEYIETSIGSSSDSVASHRILFWRG